MREVEIKARVTDEMSLMHNLRDKGVMFGKLLFQHDAVFGLPDVVSGREIGEPTDGDATAPWLRIRTEEVDGKRTVYLTLKKSQGAYLDKIEHESIVDSATRVMDIVTTLGFVKYSDVTKTRQQGSIEDMTICVDSVDGLGVFVELEKLTEDDDIMLYQEVSDEMWAILGQLGVDRINEVTKGYDVLILDKRKSALQLEH